MPSKDPNLYRLNRAVAASGLCSRRNADELIKSGRVRVNGRKTTDFNCLVDLGRDKLEIDGKSIADRKFEYIILHKPVGIVTTCNDEKGRQSVIDLLPSELRHLNPVGRLDMDSEGLLIMTNDGELAQQLTHPSRHVLKLYEVSVVGRISDAVISQLGKGVRLTDGMTSPAEVELLERDKDSSSFRIGLEEGRNRQIRRMCAKLGYPVFHLVRVAIGELQLRELEPGRWRRLTEKEISVLRSG
jgi:23S rRNA pseudouridine2605 synthase